MRKLLVLLVCAAACAESGDDAEQLETLPSVEDSPSAEPYRWQAVPEQCALLPTDGSACAHACDSEAIKQFVPEGTCATFECPLSDGSTLRAGGCNIP